MSQFALATVTATSFKQVCLKLLAELLVHFAHGAFTLAEVLEVLVNDFPLLVLLETLLAEVFEKVHAQFLLVDEAELFVEELLEAAAADSLSLFHHRGVELTFTGICRMPVEVDTQRLATTQTVGVRVAYRRVVVEVERYAVALYFLFAKEYFSAGIHCIFLELNVWCKVRLCLHGGIRHHCATIADFGQIVGGASKSSSSLRDM